MAVIRRVSPLGPATMDPARIKRYRDLPGWFTWEDHVAFDALLSAQRGRPGTLVELGCYLGKSSVVLGDHRQSGERFVVVDLFGSEAEIPDTRDGATNRRENRNSYRALTRPRFESIYREFHAELPEVVQGLSAEVVKHVEPGTARFVHVDASHVYAHVAEDIANARKLATPDGVVALDDFRAEHTPGVSGAAWEAVIRDGMTPFALTRNKMYAVWGDPQPYLDVIRKTVDAHDLLDYDEQVVVMGHRLIRIMVRPTPPSPPPRISIDDLDAIAGRVARRLLPAVAAETLKAVHRYQQMPRSRRHRPTSPKR